MSLKAFFTKIRAGIESLFDKFPAEMKTAVHIGVIVTQNIKNFVDSPEADIFTAIIPGDIDDDIKKWLRTKLPAVLVELKLADSCVGLTDPQQIT